MQTLSPTGAATAPDSPAIRPVYVVHNHQRQPVAEVRTFINCVLVSEPLNLTEDEEGAVDVAAEASLASFAWSMSSLQARHLARALIAAADRLDPVEGAALRALGLEQDERAGVAMQALRHRAHTGLAINAFVPGARREELHQFWQGYARALRDLSSGLGARLAAKDAASGAYDPPAVLKGAIGLLGDDIERLTRAEIFQRVADAGLQVALKPVPDLDVVAAGQLEDGAVAAVDANDEHPAPGVVADDGASGHRVSVGQQGSAR